MAWAGWPRRSARCAELLLVAGCWRSPPETHTPPPPPEPRPTPYDPDRGPDPQPVPVPVDAGVDGPPMPIDAPPPVAICPGGMRARIIQVVVTGATTQMTAGRGANDGVTIAWHASLERSPVPAVIKRVDPRVTVIEITATPDQIRASPFVQLCPP